MRHKSPSIRIHRPTVALLLLAALAACGQKGPLRRPDAPSAATVAPASTAETEDPSALASRRQNPHE